MKCNIKDCYWNMWNPKYELFKNEDSLVCVNESLDEHFDNEKDFIVTPDSLSCQGYLSYEEFCGVKKGEN